MDRHTLALISIIGSSLDVLGALYLAYDLLGGEHASFLTLISEVGRQLDRKVPSRATPAVVIRALAESKYLWSLVTRRPPDMTPEAAMFTCHDLSVDSSKAMRDLDYRATPLPELLRDTIAWLREAKLIA